MNKEELMELRSRITEGVSRLAVDGNGNEQERIRILLDVIGAGGANREIYETAFRLVSEQDDAGSKLDRFLDLLYGVDQDITRLDSSSHDDLQQDRNE